MGRLEGKTALVTAAGQGIGRATALKLAQDGAVVVVTDLPSTDDDAALQSLAAEVTSLSGGGLALALDITDQAQIDRCLIQVAEAFGGLDVLINNAGSSIGAVPFLDVTPEQWDLSYEINLKGPALLCRAAIPRMIARGGGAIVTNASTAGLGAEAGFGAYTATKHGLIGLTKTIAAEFGPQGIRCNAVCPGFVMTDMHAAANARLAREQNLSESAVAAQRYAGVSQRRAAEPREVAEAIAYLAGPAASYVNGVALAVSGGTPVGL